MLVIVSARGIYWLLVIIIPFEYSLCLTYSSSKNRGDNLYENDSSRKIKKFMKEEVDLDQDGLISKKEVIQKMEKSFSLQRHNEVGKLLDKFDIDYDKKISWNEFLSTAYPDDALRNSEDIDYDKKKFHMADVNRDGVLDSKEFASFYFPETSNEDMVEMVMDDWLKKVDLNHDELVTMDEFLASQSQGNPDIHDQRKLREHFKEDYDMNKDGRLDRDELKEWLVPARASAIRGTKKIFNLADNDGDDHLSMKEIIKNDHTLNSLLHDTNSNKDEL